MTDDDDKSQNRNQKNFTDEELWEYATRDVKLIKGRKKTSDQPQPAKNITEVGVSSRRRESFPETQPRRGQEVDQRTSERLRRGQMHIEGRLDLHGMTQNQAYDALLHFIPRMHAQGKRCVLVITGKGRQYTQASLLDQTIGVLKQKTPEWLGSAPLNRYVLKIEAARPQHGGEGALYVLLRRQ